MRSLALSAIAFVLCGVGVPQASAADVFPFENDPNPKFETHVRPLLRAFCLDCHGGVEPQGKLDLRLRRSLVAGGESGPAIVPGDAAGSRMLARVRSGEMPPGEKKLSPAQIALLARWVDQQAPTAHEEPDSIGADHLFPDELGYWAFRPVVRPQPSPAATNSPRIVGAIDGLVRDRLLAASLDFNPEADRRTLVRRVTFDLIGLPPTFAEVEAFVADPSPTAYEDLVDRLLASPAYGERWGRHWLDVVGYADSDGDATRDTPRPHVWRYRDWVVDAFNAGKPFDRFLTEQLAGDELLDRPFDSRDRRHIQLMTATGMLRMPADATGNGGGEEERNATVGNAVKMVTSAILGMSVACAQCHDHRYDPISQVDYYRIRAVFEPAFNPKAWLFPSQRVVSLYTDEDRAVAAAIDREANEMAATVAAKWEAAIAVELEKKLETLPDDQRAAARDALLAAPDKRTPEQAAWVASNPSFVINRGNLYQYNEPASNDLKREDAAVEAKRATKPVEGFVSVTTEPGGSADVATHLFYRGDYRAPRQGVPPGDLRVATGGVAVEFPSTRDRPTSGRRLALAQHLTSGTHPLVGRVLANRIWLHHFGRGIVDTPGEFGALGQRPTHPELLDWLADELVVGGWDIKRLQRAIVTSATYRQASTRTDANHAIDTDGALYSRYPVRRLEAEAVRDFALAVAGRLSRAQTGPPVAIDEDFGGQTSPKDDSPRRSLYVEVRRSKPIGLLTTFDAPVMEINCERRISSTVASQALMLMNNDFSLKRAADLAAQSQRAADQDGTPGGAANDLSWRSEDVWSYGHGSFVPDSGEALRFERLPHFQAGSFQGGPVLPSPTLGWTFLNATGGHPDQIHAAIRRWTAPVAGRIKIAGALHHQSEHGDGVRGRILVGGRELVGEWTSKTNPADTGVVLDRVEVGQTIDFVVDCRETVNSDSFLWQVELTAFDSTGAVIETWNSAKDFAPPQASLRAQVAHAWRIAYQRDPTERELALVGPFLREQTARARAAGHVDPMSAAMTHLCQQLLASNEFLYVD